MPLSTEQLIIAQGSTVLITGVNGFIGSNIADQFLKFGYKVRGTTRSLEKNTWISTLFNKRYGSGSFELVAVPDMAAKDAFSKAVKGASAVVHTATIFSLDPNPYNVIPGTVSGTLNALEAAAQEPSVKRFVLTSSSTAALIPKPNNPVKVTTDTWNIEAVELAYRDPPYEPERALPVYAASKTLSEKEAWKFMDERKPSFTLNTILPNMNFGASLDVANQGHPSTSAFVAELFKGNTHYLGGITAQYFVDVQDDAILHVAAAVHPDIQSERVFAFAEPVNADVILAVFRKLYPSRSFPANFRAEEDVSDIVPGKRAEALLRDMGRDGWTRLEESIKRNTEDLV
ncbi:aldehyde reductase [Colletotrichum navitas]|uniref:Aldehyde reductase n=1 Tax=Colletotrichum navitas TaxID=681940 RepID=A0AAD8PMR6_9PEZI|nr:aldehyde reductase [Colletotrichum navitas]KAK1570175.1 aldehyde reductase [Colletotrichum navitas]